MAEWTVQHMLELLMDTVFHFSAGKTCLQQAIIPRSPAAATHAARAAGAPNQGVQRQAVRINFTALRNTINFPSHRHRLPK